MRIDDLARQLAESTKEHAEFDQQLISEKSTWKVLAAQVEESKINLSRLQAEEAALFAEPTKALWQNRWQKQHSSKLLLVP